MNYTTISFKNIIRWICCGGLISVLLLLVITFKLTKDSSAVVCGIGIAFTVFLWGTLLMHLFQKKLSLFTSEICQTVDHMISDVDMRNDNTESETLLSRVINKLNMLYTVMKHQKNAVDTEHTELQQLISDISHQTKTPITNIKMINETLLQEEMVSIEWKEFLKASAAQIDKLDFLVQAMVKASRLETGVIVLEKKPFVLYQTLAAAVGGIFSLANQKQMQIIINCPENLLLLHDQKWTTEALFNILDNVVKYTPPKGQIRISVERWESYTKIDITDNGKGIAESHHNMIFKRFYREEEVHDEQGIGIGLYLTREIITLQGGYILVKSEVGNGSTFSVFLPNEGFATE